MKLSKFMKLFCAIIILPALLGCIPLASAPEDSDLPSFDDLLGYIEDGTFTKRYVPKPHRVSNIAFLQNTYESKQTPNAESEFAIFFWRHPGASFSGVTFYNDNPGRVPIEERDEINHPESFRGSYFKYACPISDEPCIFDLDQVKRISPKEWKHARHRINGEAENTSIPISSYIDTSHPEAKLTINRTRDGRLIGFDLSLERSVWPFDISAQIAGDTSVSVRLVHFDYVRNTMEIIK